MPFIKIIGIPKNYFYGNNDQKVSDLVQEIVKEEINSDAKCFFVKTEENSFGLGNQLVFFEVIYDPLPNRTFEKMQSIVQKVGELLDKMLGCNVRGRSIKLNKLEEGYYSNSTPKNKKRNFVKDESNGADVAWVFYTDNEIYRYKLAFLLESYNQHKVNKEESGCDFVLKQAAAIQNEIKRKEV